MKPDVEEILQKQAVWQKSRKSESWEEKIAKSAKARDSIQEFIRLKGSNESASSGAGGPRRRIKRFARG